MVDRIRTREHGLDASAHELQVHILIGQGIESRLPGIFGQGEKVVRFGDGDAEDILSEVAAGGFDPNDVASVRKLITQRSGEWTVQALARLEEEFFGTHTFPRSKRISVVKIGEGEARVIHVPTARSLIMGFIPEGAFPRVLREILLKKFDGEKDVMAKDMGIDEHVLELYLKDVVKPETYRDVMNIASRIKGFDHDILGNAWLSDNARSFYFKDVGEMGMNPSEELLHIEILLYSAALKMGHTDMPCDWRFTRHDIGHTVKEVMKSGFEPEIIFEVFSDYLKVESNFSVDVINVAEKIAADERPDEASYLLEIAARRALKLQDKLAAMFCFTKEADILELAAKANPKKAREINERRVDIYECALLIARGYYRRKGLYDGASYVAIIERKLHNLFNEEFHKGVRDIVERPLAQYSAFGEVSNLYPPPKVILRQGGRVIPAFRPTWQAPLAGRAVNAGLRTFTLTNFGMPPSFMRSLYMTIKP